MRPKKFVKCHFNLSVSSFGARRASPVRESHEEGAGGNEVGWFHTLGRADWVLHSELPNVMSALHVRPFLVGSPKSTPRREGDATSLIRSIKASGLHGPPPGGAILVIKLK